MIGIPLTNTITAFLLIFMGIVCLITQRNMIKALIGIEIASKGVLLNFISSGIGIAQAIVIIAILIDAITVAVAMGIIVAAFRHYESIDVEKLKRLKW